ncbi:MAG TPA: hypothetical protein VGE72_17720 [Azospirillum sp.]
MDATEATTPNSAPRDASGTRSRRKRRRNDASSSWRVASVLSAVLGVALLALALPRLEAEFSVLLARQPVLAAEAGTPVAPDLLANSARRLEDAAGRGLSVTAHDDAGRARIMLALYAGPATPQGQAELTAAAAVLRNGLAHAPAAPYVWNRLIYAEYARGRLREAAAVWRMASVTGPFDPELMARRIETGFVLWPYMDTAARDAFSRQLETHWRWNAGGLADLVDRFAMADVARRALAAYPEAAADLDRRLAGRAPR